MHAQVLVEERAHGQADYALAVPAQRPKSAPRLNTLPNLALLIVIVVAIFGPQAPISWIIATTLIGLHAVTRTRSRLGELNELLENW